LSGAGSSAGLVTLMGTLAFLLPLTIWYRYSARIASAGGLYAFVEAAVGHRVALVQAAFWIASYFLYLVYTVPYIVYDLLPTVFPQLNPYRLPVDVGIALLVGVVMLSPLIAGLTAIALIAVVQVLIALALVVVTIASLGAPAASFIGHGNFGAVLLGAGRTSSLYICASLPLFLGGEVRGGSHTVQRALTWTFPAVGALAIIGAFPFARASQAVVDADIPGVALAREASIGTLPELVGIGVVLSVAGLIFAEFFALTRLLATILARPTRWLVILSVGAFLAATLISLIDPARAYTLLLKPSLIALWISQLLVVAAYPWFAARQSASPSRPGGAGWQSPSPSGGAFGWQSPSPSGGAFGWQSPSPSGGGSGWGQSFHTSFRAGDIGLAAAASLLMLFALYTAVSQ
jgi:hypothetical protein